MIYGSVCSGIEAATVAWRPLGWRAAWYAEIDTFARAVLAYRFPEVLNLGDFTQINDAAAGAVDVLVGGTPCQSFSLAGHRLGLDDPRGNLTLEFLRLAARIRPRWIVWENVPGVLSVDRGRTFGSVLWTLAKLGYGTAYRILDAQFFGVPQRRRRVFVVGSLGGWRASAAVLFERESLRRDLAPRRKTGEIVTAITANSLGTCGGDPKQAQAGHILPAAVVGHSVSAKWAKRGSGPSGSEYHNLVGHTLNNVSVAVRRLTPRECERLQGFPDDWTLIPGYSVKLRPEEIVEMTEYLGISSERAKLYGATSDGPRYRAVGNSMAVPVMRWIGARIDHVDAVLGRAA